MMRNSAPAFIGALTTAQATDAPAQIDGPVQVRTSTLAILTASFVPAAVFTLATIPLFATIFSSWQTADWSAQILKVAIHSYLFLVIVLITLLPAALVAGITHALARSLQRTRGTDYAVIGTLVSFVVALMMYSYLPATMQVPTVVLAGALMGAVYRRFAGLEPRSPLKAALAANPSRLAGKHHLARHSRTVILNG
jgi:hypothetical protein